MSLPGKSSPKDWDFAQGVILKNDDGSLTSLNNYKLVFIGSNLKQGGIIIAARSDIFSHKSICAEITKIIKKFDLYPFY